MNKEDLQIDYEVDEEEATQPKEDKSNKEETESPVTLYIDGFVKPFQIDEVKELVSRVVKPINTDEHFYMNGARNFCYVTYKTLDNAKQALNDLDGTPFPPNSDKKLHVRITSVSAASMQNQNEIRSQKRPQRDERKPSTKPEVVSIEDLFRKTRSRPVIFYKPLTASEIEAKHKKLYIC